MLDLSPLIDRRSFMKLMSASLAMAGASCSRAPLEPIVPYATEPEGLVQGEPMFFATALTRGGYAHGVLVESNMGRPTKIEGNPAHPASLGSTGPIEQGRILELWDPERSHAALHASQIVSWSELVTAMLDRQKSWQANSGSGIRILSSAVGSPSLQRQIDALLARYPGARAHYYEPVNRDSIYAGSRLAFGRPLEPIYHFDRAEVVVALDADFLGTLPGHVRYARDFISARRPERAKMIRLYAAECMPSLTGATADHRLATRASEIARLTEQIAEQLAASVSAGSSSHVGTSAAISAMVADLKAHQGRSLVLAGEGQPAQVHALAHYINGALGNLGRTIDFIAAPPGMSECDAGCLRSLCADMRQGKVDTLFILQGNPIYDTPADAEFAAALKSVPNSIHCGLYRDETAQQCLWHVPLTHELESWGDTRAFDGTLTIQQPLIAPLYGGRSIHEVLALALGDTRATAYSVVRETWSERFGAENFEQRWRESLRSGVVSGSAAQTETVNAPNRPASQAIALVPTDPGALELQFRPDPTLWDGRYANVPWLQELPKPLTQLTWDNAAMMSPALARQLGVESQDVVELEVHGRRLRAPVWIVPTHAPEAVTLHLGSGRTQAGTVGSFRGVNAYLLRELDSPWMTGGLRLTKVGERMPLATVQYHHRMEGRDILRSGSIEQYRQNPHFAKKEGDQPIPSLYPPRPRADYAWGMSIDLNACIGCAACTIACQSENNIPTVGKGEVLNHREMHWIRVDMYEEPEDSQTRTSFQPVPCMQCEHAPCELVCPVEASVHDPQGINVQVYNRCVGTRFCSNNCPYKVRRFNFLQYSSDDPHLAGQRNPEVTVRMRGVMEKCNYCLQRLIRGRITADRDNRRLADGEVLTACQAVCPTQAIVFGDLNDPHSAVNAAKSLGRSYTLLGELNTRPRTTYLAKILNPTPDSKT